MGDEQAAPETTGVTVESLATVDLGPEIEGMAGRQLRMRMVTMEPGAVFGPVHDHQDRPGIVYILQGTITDHRDEQPRQPRSLPRQLGWGGSNQPRVWVVRNAATLAATGPNCSPVAGFLSSSQPWRPSKSPESTSRRLPLVLTAWYMARVSPTST
jgi:hypothetical protein